MILFEGTYSDLKILYYDSCSWGLHTIIDLCDCSPNFVRNEQLIKDYVNKLCKLIKATKFGETIIVNFGENEDVEGFSMIQLIETSLLSGHFVNKTNRVFMDIFSCSLYDPKIVIDFTKNIFMGKLNAYKILIRN